MKPEKIYIVSNRLPVTVMRTENGFTVTPSNGGLATALGSVFQQQNSYWIGWPGIIVDSEEEEKLVKELLDPLRCIPVFLSQQEFEGYYNGFSNAILWPLFHYHPGHCIFNEEYWLAYRNVNSKFGSVVSDYVPHEALLWIHDYQLMLLPLYLNHSNLSYFHHIHFPSQEVFGIIPWRSDLLDALLKCRHIVFQTEKDRVNFKDACFKYASKAHPDLFNTQSPAGIKVSAHPISIDAYDFEQSVLKENVQKMTTEIRNVFANQRIILSVDRLDYSKGILERLEAFRLLLRDYPRYREKLVLLMLVVPSRSDVPSYEEHKRKVDELVGNINSEYATLEWRPVHYYYQQVNRDTLCAYYAASDVCLVTSLRDGLNLVSKEYVACRTENTGVLVLSEMAGAAEELTYALKIHPYDIRQMVVAISYALEMGVSEEQARMTALKKKVFGYTVFDWLDTVFQEVFCMYEELSYSCEQNLSADLAERLMIRFKNAKSRYILLDYDGCIRELEPYPEMAAPGTEVIELLCTLLAIPNTQVVLISGRSRKDMDKWFSDCGITMIAEHGAWCKDPFSEWMPLTESNIQDSKTVSEILEKYALLMEGSFLEEKTSGVCLHFKMCEQNQITATIGNLEKEINDHIKKTNLPYRYKKTDDLLEIHFSDCDKGEAVQKFVTFSEDAFILAAGDDDTDEDMFAALPKSAFTFKIGKKDTKARIRVPNVRRFIGFLKEIAGKKVNY